MIYQMGIQRRILSYLIYSLTLNQTLVGEILYLCASFYNIEQFTNDALFTFSVLFQRIHRSKFSYCA